MYIIKRDGSITQFNKKKIINAINKAFIEVDGKLYEDDTAKDIAEDIERQINHFPDGSVGVEDLQDWIEDYLMRSERRDVARAYIRYRYKKEVARNKKDDFIKAIREKLDGNNVKNQNANVDEHSFGGRTGEASSVVTKQLALDYLLSPMARKNHIDNIIYTHDLDSYYVGSHNCLSIPFDDLLANGFNTRQADVRPAGSINTAFQLIAVIFQIQSLCQFGGVSATHLDWTMVPYIRKSFWKHFKDGVKYLYSSNDYNYIVNNVLGNLDTSKMPIQSYRNATTRAEEENAVSYLLASETYKKAYDYAYDMTIRETHQAAEGLYHNLNTLQSRSGNQLPFTSINYGTCTLPEGRMVTKALLDVSIEGLGKLHKTSIFPCGIFQCMKGVNRKPGEPNYDLYRLALESTARRLYPNYANVDWSGNAGYDINDPRTYFSTMGCRTANGWDINGFGQLKDGRGNICPVTIILPTLAMIAKEECEKEGQEEDIIPVFLALLDRKINEARIQLMERFEWICSQDPGSARFMYENNVMAGYVPEEGIRSALKHGTLAIG